jgi:hypothetical protein
MFIMVISKSIATSRIFSLEFYIVYMDLIVVRYRMSGMSIHKTKTLLKLEKQNNNRTFQRQEKEGVQQNRTFSFLYQTVPFKRLWRALLQMGSTTSWRMTFVLGGSFLVVVVGAEWSSCCTVLDFFPK